MTCVVCITEFYEIAWIEIILHGKCVCGYYSVCNEAIEQTMKAFRKWILWYIFHCFLFIYTYWNIHPSTETPPKHWHVICSLNEWFISSCEKCHSQSEPTKTHICIYSYIKIKIIWNHLKKAILSVLRLPWLTHVSTPCRLYNSIMYADKCFLPLMSKIKSINLWPWVVRTLWWERKQKSQKWKHFQDMINTSFEE